MMSPRTGNRLIQGRETGTPCSASRGATLVNLHDDHANVSRRLRSANEQSPPTLMEFWLIYGYRDSGSAREGHDRAAHLFGERL